MNRAAMITYFEELYNLSSHTNDGKLDDEIDVYLNLAQDEFIDDQFIDKEGVGRILKDSHKSYDNLRTLMKTTSSLTLAAGVEIVNSSNASFPADMRYHLTVRCQLTKNSTNPTQSWYFGKIINPINIWKYVYTGNNNPIIINPLYTILEDKLHIIHENSDTLDAVKLDYIKEPALIASGQDCELPANTHFDIVKKAVNIGLKASGIEPSEKLGLELQEGEL